MTVIPLSPYLLFGGLFPRPEPDGLPVFDGPLTGVLPLDCFAIFSFLHKFDYLFNIEQVQFRKMVRDNWGHKRKMITGNSVADQIRRLLKKHGLTVKDLSNVILGAEHSYGPESLDTQERQRHLERVKKNLQRDAPILSSYKDILLDHLQYVPGTNRTIEQEIKLSRQQTAPEKFREIARNIGTEIRRHVSERHVDED